MLTLNKTVRLSFGLLRSVSVYIVTTIKLWIEKDLNAYTNKQNFEDSIEGIFRRHLRLLFDFIILPNQLYPK